MRILIAVNEYPPDCTAGTAVSTGRLAKFLARDGHAVLVLVTTRIKAPREEYINGIAIRRFKGGFPKGTGWLGRLFFIFREARKFKPDVIQGQAVSCGLLAAIVGWLLKKPSITYAQGQDVYQASRWQLATEIKWGCNWASAVIAVSNHLAGKIRSISGHRDVHVIPHGIDILPISSCDPRFLQRLNSECDKIGQHHLALNVGRLEYIKGQDILLSAWEKVSVVHPDARLWIVGDGSRMNELQAYAADAGLENSVRFWGYLSPAEVSAVMSAATLFVLPSRSEAFGIVLVEAMAHGLPIIISRGHGVADIIPPDGDAVIVPPEDAERLSQALIKGLNVYRKPSLQNQNWADRFAWGRLVHKFVDLYTSVCT